MRAGTAFASLLLVAGCAASNGARGGGGAPSSTAPVRVPHPAVTPFLQAVVDAPDRFTDDRALDAGRHPAELLAFAEIAPGGRVAELGAGRGYTTELLARAVGELGQVYAQNNRFILEKFAAQPWSERLQRPSMRKVVRVDREFDDPLPPEAHDLDVVCSVLIYHDTVWMGADRDKMNRAVFQALRPGGLYVVVDHAARPGAGLADVKTFHRIEEATVRQEVERAGFRLRMIGDFLRNPADQHDWNDSPTAAGGRRGTSDRFALQFEKPRG
jgi:predicted methyltransferase